MLTISQQVILEHFANKVIEQITEVFKTKQIQRKSVRFVGGEKIETLFSAPVSATGSLAKSLRFELTDTSLTIYASDYAYYLIWGRKPGNVSETGQEGIRKWIRAKGIKSDISENQAVYLISRKLKLYGNSIYLFSGNNNSGLLNNVLTDALKKEFNTKFTAQLAEDLANEF